MYFIFLVIAYLCLLYFIQHDIHVNISTKIMAYDPSMEDCSIKIYRLATSLMFSIILVSICYFITNFIRVQKLKDDISEQSRN